LAGNDVDSGRQSATSHVPKTKAGIEKMPCKLFMTNRRGELESTWDESLLKGPMSSTVEKPTINTHITISIVISCTK
jgi:hypothetical protein